MTFADMHTSVGSQGSQLLRSDNRRKSMKPLPKSAEFVDSASDMEMEEVSFQTAELGYSHD